MPQKPEVQPQTIAVKPTEEELRFAMPETNDDWKQIREDAQALRDEIRLKLHLGGMEARDAFHRLERDAEHLAQKLGADSRGAWTDLVQGMKKLRDQLLAETGRSDRV